MFDLEKAKKKFLLNIKIKIFIFGGSFLLISMLIVFVWQLIGPGASTINSIDEEFVKDNLGTETIIDENEKIIFPGAESLYADMYKDYKVDTDLALIAGTFFYNKTFTKTEEILKQQESLVKRTNFFDEVLSEFNNEKFFESSGFSLEAINLSLSDIPLYKNNLGYIETNYYFNHEDYKLPLTDKDAKLIIELFKAQKPYKYFSNDQAYEEIIKIETKRLAKAMIHKYNIHQVYLTCSIDYTNDEGESSSQDITVWTSSYNEIFWPPEFGWGSLSDDSLPDKKSSDYCTYLAQEGNTVQYNDNERAPKDGFPYGIELKNPLTVSNYKSEVNSITPFLTGSFISGTNKSRDQIYKECKEMEDTKAKWIKEQNEKGNNPSCSGLTETVDTDFYIEKAKFYKYLKYIHLQLPVYEQQFNLEGYTDKTSLEYLAKLERAVEQIIDYGDYFESQGYFDEVKSRVKSALTDSGGMYYKGGTAKIDGALCENPSTPADIIDSTILPFSLDDVEYLRITSYFGNRNGIFSGKKIEFHDAIDIGKTSSYNPVILSVAEGVVITSGFNTGGFGNRVVIQSTSSNGTVFTHRYAHLSSIDSNIVVGAKVTQGQKIGVMGKTGNSTGVHLDFNIQIGDKKIDPMGIFCQDYSVVVGPPNGFTGGSIIVDEALKYLGKPYVLGGDGPSVFDCSGFVKYVFDKVGQSFASRRARDIYEETIKNTKLYKRVKKSDLQPGDMLFYKGDGPSGEVTHVAIYGGIDQATGKGFYIEANSGSMQVQRTPIDSYFHTNFYFDAVRVLKFETTLVQGSTDYKGCLDLVLTHPFAVINDRYEKMMAYTDNSKIVTGSIISYMSYTSLGPTKPNTRYINRYMTPFSKGDGLLRLDGKEIYAVALGTAFGPDGSMYRITFKDTGPVDVVKVDEKDKDHTFKGCYMNFYGIDKYNGNLAHPDLSVVELVLNTSEARSRYGRVHPNVYTDKFKGEITNIQYLGRDTRWDLK